MIRIKRVQDPVEPSDGTRVLVDRLWPRGMKKAALRLDRWQKEVAPSDGLRRWFHHDPGKWEEFRRRYLAELEAHPGVWEPLAQAGRGPLTLLYSAHDTQHNNATVLREFLLSKLGEAQGPAPLPDGEPDTPAGKVAA
jgi:uncharacterized protein YeaO (DUF488 family)